MRYIPGMSATVKGMETARTLARESDQRTYKTERACVRGHKDERYAENGTCVSCDFLRRKQLAEA
jgi:hypothetical protein